MSVTFGKILGLISVFVLPTVSYLPAPAQSAGEPVYERELKDHWQLMSSRDLPAGRVISTEGFKATGWHRAMVPGSVLGSLVDDSVFRDPFFGRNLEKIPDSLFDVPWWYRTVFTLGNLRPGQITRLAFNGINYRADIWLNGHQIASGDSVKGGFCRFEFDISRWVNKGKNVLAVRVTRPGPGDLTLGFVDWNPEPPDHNMGIWRDVLLKVTGPVSIQLPFVKTEVDTATLDHARLTVTAGLRNHSEQTVHGMLTGMIGNAIRFSQPVTLSGHETREIVFDPAGYPMLNLDHPRLWWTHTLGKPNLYRLRLRFKTGDAVSDERRLSFGVRSVSDYIDADGHRGFRLNGKKILIRGGGWTDPMLLNATPAYEEAGIAYAVHMNLNTIRMEGFWGHDQHLYDLCDERGILIMVGFSCQWEWAHLIGMKKEDQYSAILSQEQNEVAARSWRDQITWLRNHPSIFLWLYGSDKWPRPSLEKNYLATLKTYDPTRPAISSAKEHTSEITGPSAVKMRGPYDYVPPDYWYLDTAYGGAFGFNTETGPGPQIPVLESLKKMIPADSLWPIGSAWLYHAARGKFHNLSAYNNAMDQRLGKPAGLTDYLRKAQFLNYEGMRAMFEAFEANRFRATGIIQWMYNASWPKLWWQFYDYYLMPTGAFYGARKAGEPLHIAYNYGNRRVEVINNTLEEFHHLRCEVAAYDFSMRRVWHREVSVDEVGGQQSLGILSLPDTLPVTKTWFLRLVLKTEDQQVKSRNFYALSTRRDLLDEAKSTWYITPESQFADLTMLQQLPAVKLEARSVFSRKGDTTLVRVRLKNATGHVAFMISLDLQRGTGGPSVVPVFWEANYFSLLPGEERTITGYCKTSDLEGAGPAVSVGGWNVQ